jgi:hypothetical protein
MGFMSISNSVASKLWPLNWRLCSNSEESISYYHTQPEDSMLFGRV